MGLAAMGLAAMGSAAMGLAANMGLGRRGLEKSSSLEKSRHPDAEMGCNVYGRLMGDANAIRYANAMGCGMRWDAAHNKWNVARDGMRWMYDWFQAIGDAMIGLGTVGCDGYAMVMRLYAMVC